MQPRNEPPNPTPSQLPETLGFGRLDPPSIYSDPQELYAEYHLGVETVYAVRHSAQGWQLEEFYAGRSLGTSRQPTLMKAFFLHTSLYAPAEHPRLAGIMARLKRRANIQFVLPSKVRYLFFPAGLIFYLYLPVLAYNRTAWEGLKHQEGLRGASNRLHFPVDSPPLIYRVKRPATCKPESVEFMELSASLIELEEVCWWLHENEVILMEEAFPLLVRLNRVIPRQAGKA